MTYTILLVEDNLDDVKQTLRAFARSNIANEVVVARDGAEASTFLFGPGPARSFALVLLDLKLPRIAGLQVLARIRGDERTRDLPVMILTSSTEPQDLVASYGAGADNYLKKPVDFASFLVAARSAGMSWTLVERGLALLHGESGPASEQRRVPHLVEVPATTVLLGVGGDRLRTCVTVALERDGFAVRSTATAQATFMALLSELPEVAVLDERLAGVGGVDIARALQGRSVVAVVLSATPAVAQRRVPPGTLVCEPTIRPITAMLRRARHLALLHDLAAARVAQLAPPEAWSLLDLPASAAPGAVAHAMQVLVNALDLAGGASSVGVRSAAILLATRLRRSVAELGG